MLPYWLTQCAQLSGTAAFSIWYTAEKCASGGPACATLTVLMLSSLDMRVFLEVDVFCLGVLPIIVGLY